MKWVVAAMALTFSGCVTRQYAELRYWQGRFDSTLNCADLVAKRIQ